MKVKEAVVLAVIQIVLYSLICVNYRAIAQLHYHEAAMADFLIASMNFFVIRKIAQSGDAFHQWDANNYCIPEFLTHPLRLVFQA